MQGENRFHPEDAFHYLGTLSAPDSNIVSPVAAFPSDIMYNTSF